MRQRLGQHFLKDKTVLARIAASLEMEGGDVVFEVGPGHGELTRELLAQAPEAKIIAVERDPTLVASLKKDFSGDPSLEIIEGDAAILLPKLINGLAKNAAGAAKTYKVVGNIPYYITGRLFRLLGDAKKKPARCVFTVQREVGERAMAKNGEMNLLSASLRLWAEPKILFYIGKEAFSPPPRVGSVVILLERKPRDLASGAYFKLIRALFKQPRKTILNNLRSGLNLKREEADALLIGSEILPEQRPQDLSIETIEALLRTLVKAGRQGKSGK